MNFLQSLSEMEEWNGGQGPVEQVAPEPKIMKQASGKKTLMHMMYRTQAEEEEVSAQHDGLIKFFQENPSPSEDEMNAFAEEMGTDPDALDERIYALLSSLLKGVGKNNDMPDSEFDPEQLSKGIETEMEHTEDELIAKMIAKDHLAEVPDYYDRLGQMEDEYGDEENADAEMDMEMGGDEDMDMGGEEDMGADEDMDMDMEMGDEDYDDEDMEGEYDDDEDYDDEDYDDEDMDPEGLGDEDYSDEDPDDDEDLDDMDPNYEDDPESEFKSGDLEDDEFEINLGAASQIDTSKDRPRKKKGKSRKKRVKRLTFKESLING